MPLRPSSLGGHQALLLLDPLQGQLQPVEADAEAGHRAVAVGEQRADGGVGLRALLAGDAAAQLEAGGEGVLEAQPQVDGVVEFQADGAVEDRPAGVVEAQLAHHRPADPFDVELGQPAFAVAEGEAEPRLVGQLEVVVAASS